MRFDGLWLVPFTLQPKNVIGYHPGKLCVKCPGFICGGPGGIRTHDLRRVRATSVPCDLSLTRLDYRPLFLRTRHWSRERLVVYRIFDKDGYEPTENFRLAQKSYGCPVPILFDEL